MGKRNKVGRPRKTRSRPENLRPKPAPGRLEIVQDFVNTYDAEAKRDELASPEALAQWLVEHKLLPSVAELDEDTWRRILQLREGLRAVLRSHNGAPFSAEALELVNRELRDAHPFLHLRSDGRMGVELPDGGWTGAVTKLADILLEATTAGSWKRLKTCRNPECKWVFYDSTSNLNGKWCHPRRCGNRAHTKTYRRRGPSFKRRGWIPPDIEAGMKKLEDEMMKPRKR